MSTNFNDLNQPIFSTEQNYEDSSNQRSPEEIQYIKSLEGQCKIIQHTFLRISWPKILAFFVPTLFSIVGLILIIKSKRLRTKLFYEQLQAIDKNNSTHIYVKSDKIQAICQLHKRQIKNKKTTIFKFQELTYEIFNDLLLPLAADIQKLILKSFNKVQLDCSSCSYNQDEQMRQLFGSNQHKVQQPSYLQFMFESLTHPLILTQYFTLLVYYLLGQYVYDIVLFTTSFLTININYFLTRKSFNKIKRLAQKSIKVKILKEGKLRQAQCSQLVPGNIYAPLNAIPCDSIIIKGSLFVNQVGFTGENIPISKVNYNHITNKNSFYNPQHWAYDGSTIVSIKQGTFLLAINTGFTSRKGRIIRKILNSNLKTNSSEFFNNFIFFMSQVVLVNIILFFSFYNYMFESSDTDIIFKIQKFLEFIINSTPSSLIIYINILHTIMLLRLNSKQIIGTKPHKTIQGSRLKTLCFDKTGTITENTMSLQKIFILNSQKQEIISSKEIEKYKIIQNIFASCHSLQIINQQSHGDQIDLKMFQSSKVTINLSTNNKQIIFTVYGDQIYLQIYKIHQFQSKFQSMSVLVKDKIKNQSYIFTKGSPQMLHSISDEKYHYFNNLIKKVSLDGYRIIGFGFKKIETEQQFNNYLQLDREEYLLGIKMIGFTTFSNKLKPDAKETVNILTQSAIECKIITGDNIFVAVKTAFNLNFIPNNKRILILEGNKLLQNGNIQAVSIQINHNIAKQQGIQIDDINNTILNQQFIAVDDSFMKNNTLFMQNNNCIIFARATPQSKKMIIQFEKAKIKNKRMNLPWKDKIFGLRASKVGMVGDGANDLMAINQSDLGISLNQSDAVYSSDFSINSLSQIITLICESKSGQQKQIEICQNTMAFLLIYSIIQIHLTEDMSYFPAIPSMIRNFLFAYQILVLISLTPSLQKMTKFSPSSNLIGLQHQITWWGSMLITACGLSACIFYYEQTDDFIPNPNKQKLSQSTKLATLSIICEMFINIFLVIGFSRSYPFKNSLFFNIPAMLVLLVNFILYTTILFLTQKFSFLQFQAIALEEALKIFLILLITGVLIIVYNHLITSLKLFQRQTPYSNNQTKSLTKKDQQDKMVA